MDSSMDVRYSILLSTYMQYVYNNCSNEVEVSEFIFLA